MNMSQRREKMVEMINRERSVSFAQLKQFFHPASDMTLRRDLEYCGTWMKKRKYPFPSPFGTLSP